MKRLFIPALASLLAIFLIGCGGAGSDMSGDYPSGTTSVVITLGTAQAVSKAAEEASPASYAIPGNVSRIVFEISGDSMTTITRTVVLSGQTTITESFDVPAGPNRRFQVNCLDSRSAVTYTGSTVVDVGAIPLTLSITMTAATYSISGTVYDYSGGTGQSNMTVILYRPSATPAAGPIEIARTTTDNAGNYAFTGLIDGAYEVGTLYSGLTAVTISGASVAGVFLYVGAL